MERVNRFIVSDKLFNNMEPSLEALRESYQQFDDHKLIKIATQEASVLRPEALKIIKSIIKERRLSEDILTGIEAQFGFIDDDTLLEYCDLLRCQPCPICNSRDEKLNATMIGVVKSFVVITNYEKELKIACPNCLDNENAKAIKKSSLLGWWSFPWGIIKTSQAINFNGTMRLNNRNPEPNELLKAFVLERIGRIEANRNNPNELQFIIEDTQVMQG